jgi:hypothetical protein
VLVAVEVSWHVCALEPLVLAEHMQVEHVHGLPSVAQRLCRDPPQIS